MACLIGIVSPNAAKFRGWVAIMEATFFFAVAAGYYSVGIDNWQVAAGFGALAVVGIVLHSREPGLFTEDKNNKKKD